MHERALVIGLDCAAPQLLFDRWLDELPVLRALTQGGSHGILRSCDPPITVPAWSCMSSSRDPGALGIYGFRNRVSHDSYELSLADSRAVREPRVWELLMDRDRPSVTLGVPQTFPIRPLNGGATVACFLTPDVDRFQYTHPPELADEIRRLVGSYLVDVAFRTEDKRQLLADIEEMTNKRWDLAEHLLTTRPWDLFFLVEIGTDRMHHAFWRFVDPEHRRYESDSPFASAMLDYYRDLDARLGRLLELVGEETAVLVVSDHGAQRMDGGICVNEWLRANGYLTLKREPLEPSRLEPEDVDWDRTVAWGEGGYYCRLFLNVAGREPQGAVAPADYESVREEIKLRLEALGDENGDPIGTTAHRPEDLYRERNGIPPDLMVYFGDLRWRSIGRVGGGAIHSFDNDTGPDDANHAPEGLYVLCADGARPGPGPQHSLLDIAPTILTALGEPVPANMEGRSLL
jgi:predicted AlkP superfamily phosphohydrolase/phosphomutase